MHWLSNISKGDGFHLVTTLSDKKVYGENKAYPPHLTHTHYTIRCIDGVEGARFSSAVEIRSNQGKVIITSHIVTELSRRRMTSTNIYTQVVINTYFSLFLNEDILKKSCLSSSGCS